MSDVLAQRIEAVLRADGARLLASLIRLAGNFEHAEDALQEACVRALEHWSRDGLPDNAGAWLNTVARRIVFDRQRGVQVLGLDEAQASADVDPAELDASGIEDDRLRLLFTCCHPALSMEARCALALRTLGGLTTREIARAFVESEATTAQRIVRAKKKIAAAGIAYEVPARAQLPQRLEAVLAVLYLIFNEGHTATEAITLQRPDLCREAIRLARLAAQLMPEQLEAQALLALMLLTDARRAARIDASGALIPLQEQDRSLWNRAQIEAGTRLLDGALCRASAAERAQPYALQAAIAAVHAGASSASLTDWAQIALLYQGLLRVAPSAVVALNAAVAHGMAHDVDAALSWIERIEAGGALAGYHLLPAARGELLRLSSRFREAATAYRDALTLVRNACERGYLEMRLSGVETHHECWRSSTSSGLPLAE